MFSSVDVIWTLLGAALVFFMQAGFAMVEAGFTRAKNAGNIIMKNLMDFCIGTPAFWILGFGLMFGASNGGLIGTPDFMVQQDYSALNGLPTPVFLIFQTVFCATAATIVSGAMAERTKFVSYCVYSLIISLVIYPISGHWIWNPNGWLAQLGFHDFAGSTAVHMVGGAAALVGAKILGPRIGKYDKDGKPRAIPGHNLPIGALGVFILWFCWFGFNGTSTVSATGDSTLISMGNIFVTTNMAAACSTVTVMLFTWARYKKPDVSMTLNGSLAGLVAITAGCDMVSPLGAAAIGIIAGFAVVLGIEFIDKKAKIDDPVGAIGVHGICGALGTLLTGFFAVDKGVLYGGGFAFFEVQALGVVSVIAWVVLTMSIVFTILKKTIGLRVTPAEEMTGLDLPEHGLISSYPDFAPNLSEAGLEPADKVATAITPPAEHPIAKAQAVPVEIDTGVSMSGAKMTKAVILTSLNKFKDLKNALSEIGITGMTVSNVMGFGIQKGHTEYYRGVEMASTLLPKVKVEVVIAKIPVAVLIQTVTDTLYTGHIGDGKIFLYNVENVIKIRTGEQGYDALQDLDI